MAEFDGLGAIVALRDGQQPEYATLFSDRIAELVDIPDDTPSLADQTMQRIGAMASDFAFAMISNRMPTTTLVEYDGDTPPSNKGQLTTITNHAGWIVLRDQDLSDRSMTSARLGVQTCSYSLGSGTPNNFKTEWTNLNPDHLESLNIKSNQRLRYHAKAVAVDWTGRLVTASQFYDSYSGDDIFFGTRHLDYVINNSETVDPRHLFNPAELTKKQAELHVQTMRERMERAIELYAAHRSSEDPTITAARTHQHYMPETKVIGKTQKPKRFPRLRQVPQLFH